MPKNTAPQATTFHSFCYALVRAHQDSDLFVEPLRLLSGPEQDVTVRELLAGQPDLERLGVAHVRWPDELRAWQGSSAFAPPGGESLDDHVARVAKARDALIAARPGQVVVVVSHVTPIRSMLRDALDAGIAAMWRIKIDPCSVSIIRQWADGNAEVSCVNVTGD